MSSLESSSSSSSSSLERLPHYVYNFLYNIMGLKSSAEFLAADTIAVAARYMTTTTNTTTTTTTIAPKSIDQCVQIVCGWKEDVIQHMHERNQQKSQQWRGGGGGAISIGCGAGRFNIATTGVDFHHLTFQSIASSSAQGGGRGGPSATANNDNSFFASVLVNNHHPTAVGQQKQLPLKKRLKTTNGCKDDDDRTHLHHTQVLPFANTITNTKTNTPTTTTTTLTLTRHDDHHRHNECCEVEESTVYDQQLISLKRQTHMSMNQNPGIKTTPSGRASISNKSTKTSSRKRAVSSTVGLGDYLPKISDDPFGGYLDARNGNWKVDGETTIKPQKNVSSVAVSLCCFTSSLWVDSKPSTH
jgi:hypothetical protein